MSMIPCPSCYQKFFTHNGARAHCASHVIDAKEGPKRYLQAMLDSIRAADKCFSAGDLVQMQCYLDDIEIYFKYARREVLDKLAAKP